jgi:hypothetical protein
MMPRDTLVIADDDVSVGAFCHGLDLKRGGVAPGGRGLAPARPVGAPAVAVGGAFG